MKPLLKKFAALSLTAAFVMTPAFSYADGTTATVAGGSHKAYMSGSTDGFFYPDAAISRAETAQLLSNVFSSELTAKTAYTGFSDVGSDQWYAPAVSKLASAGLLNTDTGTYRPSDSITRAEFITLIYRMKNDTSQTEPEESTKPETPVQSETPSGTEAASGNDDQVSDSSADTGDTDAAGKVTAAADTGDSDASGTDNTTPAAVSDGDTTTPEEVNSSDSQHQNADSDTASPADKDDNSADAAADSSDAAAPDTDSAQTSGSDVIGDVADGSSETQKPALFTDVAGDFWGYDAVKFISEMGWVNGYEDGTFLPGKSLTRAEAATIINRAAGRVPDAQTINNAWTMRYFPDLPGYHWAYANIMEAAVDHTCAAAGVSESWTDYDKTETVLSPGQHLINGKLYYVKADQTFARGEGFDGYYYGTSRYWSTGNTELDNLLFDITSRYINDSMPKEERLRVLFNYVINNYTYLKRDIVAVGATGWQESYAVPMLQKHKGNCFSFASIYYYLAKGSGFSDLRVVSGLVGHNRRPHGWVEINIGGTSYIYDTELTMAKRAIGENRYLYKMTHSSAPYIYAYR